MELKKILLQNKNQFARALAEKLLTYGLGRGMEAADKCLHRCDCQDVGLRMVTDLIVLITAVVDSDPFANERRTSAK